MSTQGSARPALVPPSEQPRAETADARYRIVGSGDAPALICTNASNLTLRVVAGLTVTRAARRRYPPRTIFLDGVYNGAPFVDNSSQHYSLDHHAGCVRGFTIATCEQAVVMLLQGIPLAVGDWTIYVNDPDLDSVLAAWILLNHMDLLRARKVLRAIMPLVRLEGVIDAHGTDKELLAALPDDLHAETKKQIDQLMKRERELKASGKWFQTDWLEYTKHMFEALDQLAYTPEMLADLAEVQEDGRANLGHRMAVLMRSKLGIYALESRLKERHGDHLGLIVLDLSGGRFTLRQVDTFLKKDLNAVYKALNKRDTNARSDSDAPNVWGGSAEIGGAPRATGTALSGDEILAIIEQVLGPRDSLWKRALRGLWRLMSRGASAGWGRIVGARRERPALPPADKPSDPESDSKPS